MRAYFGPYYFIISLSKAKTKRPNITTEPESSEILSREPVIAAQLEPSMYRNSLNLSAGKIPRMVCNLVQFAAGNY